MLTPELPRESVERRTKRKSTNPIGCIDYPDLGRKWRRTFVLFRVPAIAQLEDYSTGSRTGKHVSASATALGNGGTPVSSFSTSTNSSRSPTDQSLNVPLSTNNPRAQFPEPVPFSLPDSTPSSTVTADRRVNGPGSRAFHEFEECVIFN